MAFTCRKVQCSPIVIVLHIRGCAFYQHQVQSNSVTPGSKTQKLPYHLHIKITKWIPFLHFLHHLDPQTYVCIVYILFFHFSRGFSNRRGGEFSLSILNYGLLRLSEETCREALREENSISRYFAKETFFGWKNWRLCLWTTGLGITTTFLFHFFYLILFSSSLLC